jgi:serine/threonine-protein kinase
VLKLAAGSSARTGVPFTTVLPFTNPDGAFGVAVDAAGNLYVADQSNNQVLKLAAG